MLDKKPNVIIIYPDQLRYDCLGFTGNSVIKTPGFDRLANEGISFNNAYTSFPLCCPFRASILTGKYAHKNGMYANHYKIPLNQEFLPQIMKDNGYRTGWIGKWHLSGGGKAEYVPDEYKLGFEHFIGFTRGHQYFSSIFYRNDDPQPRKSTMYEPDYQTTHAMEFMDQSLKENKPFFLGISYGIPHTPLVAPEWYLNLYSADEMYISDTVPEEGREKAKEFLAKYYGLVSAVDVQITTLLNHLDRLGLSDDTFIIFVSDHGELGGEHGLYGKRSAHEASMHVPFILKYPAKFNKNAQVETLVDPSVDIFPTILDVCGISLPEYIQGRSLKSILEIAKTGEVLEANNDDFVFYELIKQPFAEFKEIVIPERGIRTKDYLYVAKDQKPFKLFDLINDPKELNNLINNPEYQNVLQQLDNLLQAKMEQTEDDWNICFDQSIDNFQTHKDGNDYSKILFENAICENAPI